MNYTREEVAALLNYQVSRNGYAFLKPTRNPSLHGRFTGFRVSTEGLLFGQVTDMSGEKVEHVIYTGLPGDLDASQYDFGVHENMIDLIKFQKALHEEAESLNALVDSKES